MYMFSFSRSVANILDYHVVERKILAKQCRVLCQLISYVCYMSRRVPKTVVLHRLSQAAAAIVVKYPVCSDVGRQHEVCSCMYKDKSKG